jgi:hypothetical protein
MPDPTSSAEPGSSNQVTDPVPATAGERRRHPFRSFIELFALCGFAFAQPLLDVFGRGVEQFAFRGASPLQIVLFGVAITFLPALGLWTAEMVVAVVLGPRAGSAVHLTFVVGLVIVFAMQAARPLGNGAPLVIGAVLLGVAAGAAYQRFPVVHLWLAFAALAPLGFLLLFLTSSSTSRLLSADEAVPEVDVGAPAPVVMVVLDELPMSSLLDPERGIDRELFPNLAALADDSHWFRNTTTVSTSTWHAVPALVTGQMPEDDTLPISDSHPDSLFTMLGASYDMHVTETNTRLCPASVCPYEGSASEVWRGLAHDVVGVTRDRLSPTRRAEDPVSGFAELTNPEDEWIYGSLQATQPERFRSLLDGLDDDPDEDEALYFLHMLLPHVPYQYLPSGLVYPPPDPEIGRIPQEDTWRSATAPVETGRQRHLLQAAYVDSLIGDLVQQLEDQGIYDDALIVLTADHGISFEPDGPIRGIEGQALTPEVAADIPWVPLFVKEPGQTEGDVSDANVLTIDVLPTIADVLDIDIPFPVDGRSALGPPREDDAKPISLSEVTTEGVTVLDPVELPAGSRDLMYERTLATFLPAIGDPWRWWRLGPAPDLVGRPVSELGDDLEPVDAALLDPQAYANVGSGGLRPALVRGTVAIDPESPIAVSVNGVVAATSRAYVDAGTDVEFGVMVDERLLRPGSNEIAVYAVRATG